MKTAYRFALMGCVFVGSGAMAAEDPLCATLKTLTNAAHEKPPFASLANASTPMAIGTGEACKQDYSRSRANKTEWVCGLGRVQMDDAKEGLGPAPFMAAYLERGGAVVNATVQLVPRIVACLGPGWTAREEKPTPTPLSLPGGGQTLGSTQRVIWTAPDKINVSIEISDFRAMSATNGVTVSMTTELRVDDGR